MSEPEGNFTRIGEILAEKFGVKNLSVTQKASDKTIENYFGVIHPLTITGLINEEVMSKRIILKLGKSNKGLEYIRVLREVYEIEIYFYKKILPIYSYMLNKSYKIAPECYFIEENPDPLIVLQDMRDIGYQRYEGKRFDEIEHVLVALKSLAEHHAMSIVVKDKNILFDDHILRPYTPSYPMEYNDAIKNSFMNNLHLFRNSPLEEFFENLISNYDYSLNVSNSQIKYVVYGHGDFWMENILFKYENNKPVSACLIDFQKTRALSPAQDFLHLLTTSVESNIRREHIEVFIASYLDTVNSILNQNDVHISYTRDDFIHDLKIVAPLNTAITFMSFSLWSGLEGKAFVQSKNIVDVDSIQLVSKEFKENIINVVADLRYLGFIHI